MERRARVGVLAALLVLGAWAGQAGASVKVERGENGLSVAAEGAALEDVLQALADEEGFEVRMRQGIERRPVDLSVSDASLERVLRRVLSRRSYSISYEETEDGLAVSRVTVLLPQGGVTEVATTPQVRAPSVMTRQQRAAASAAAAARRAEQLRRQRDEARRTAVQRYRENQAKRLAARRAAVAAAARRAAAQQQQETPLRRLLWQRAR